MTSRQCSTLEIDIAWASSPSGLSADPTLEEHVAACARCTAYVAELRALDEPVALRSVRPAPKMRAWRRQAAAVIGGLALAASVFFFVRSRAHEASESGGYVGAKGAPALQLIVRRNQATRIWDGKEALRAGDSVALHVACEGYAHVIVAAKDHDRWVRLSETACPKTPAVLPFTLIVDNQPGSEQLGIVLSREKLDEVAASAALDAPSPSARAWATQFLLQKETGR